MQDIYLLREFYCGMYKCPIDIVTGKHFDTIMTFG